MIARCGRSVALGAALFGLLNLTVLPRSSLAQSRADLFPVYPGLEPVVEFWKRVFSEWSQDQVVFHDRDDPDIVYGVIWQKKSETRTEYIANEDAQERIIEGYREILLALADRDPAGGSLTGDHARIAGLFGARGGPDRYRRAADRIRVQRGIAERFEEGLLNAMMYRDRILAVLREEGVPEEIVWLPMVESTFNLEARSKVGAAGVWQFMPSTARKYMRVDRAVDERFDPIVAAQGAARLLKWNLEGLGSWALALTAYNHGYYGMRRAIRSLGTNDYMTIRRYYESRSFRFASKNFYPEFLAAVEVAENADRYFGSTPEAGSFEFEHVVVPTTMRLSEIAEAVQVEVDDLAELNPALTDAVRRGRRSVPGGYRLRVPEGVAGDAPMQLASGAAAKSGSRVQGSASKSGSKYYTVQRGDTLISIASRHGVSVAHLIDLNDIEDENRILIGQRLKVAQ